MPLLMFVFFALFLLHDLRSRLLASVVLGLTFLPHEEFTEFIRYANVRPPVTASLCFMHNPQGDRTEVCATGHLPRALFTFPSYGKGTFL